MILQVRLVVAFFRSFCPWAVVLSLAGCEAPRASVQVDYTVGDLSSVHDDVKVEGALVRGSVRVSTQDRIVTGSSGRARIQLDSGATVAVHGETRFRLEEGRLVLEEGRVFVTAGETPLEVAWSGNSTKVTSAAAAFDFSPPGEFRVYCAEGELVVLAGGEQHRVEAGETARVDQGKLRTLPEKAFEDWTGGLAEPGRPEVEGKSAIPHARARISSADPGSPLVVRSHQVDTKVVGEVAVTKSRTTYFNGSDSSGEAHVRLALPEKAILMKVAARVGKSGAEQQATLQIAAGPSRTFGYESLGLEWAGGGWLQGTVARIAPSDTLELSLEYAEWLPVVRGKSTYRYAKITDPEQAKVGELSLRVDVQETKTPSLTVSRGAEVKGRQVTYRASDVHSSGDFVVELAPEVVSSDEARVYVERTGPQKKDAFVYVRTELPEKKFEGVRLALVLDTSQSMVANLETSLAVVDAVLGSLGPQDSVVLLSAEEETEALGPSVPRPVTPSLKKELEAALSKVRPGGASNLSLALERATDVLNQGDAGAEQDRMVVYIGDGRPSVGEPDAVSIRNLLASRPEGLPRLSAVAVGPSADQWMLARLVAKSGVLARVSDRPGAARAGALLLAEALTPRFRAVELDFGPHVDRVYPRGGQVVTAGTTVEFIGRLSGPVPTKVGIRYRGGSEEINKTIKTKRLAVPPSGDLGKKWASARVAQIAEEGEGIEPAILIAEEYRLTTPWTSWLFDAPGGGQATRSYGSRILELSPSTDTSYVPHLLPVLVSGASLIELGTSSSPKGTLVSVAEAAMRRIITQASRSVRACRDARAAVNPEVGDSFRLEVSVDGNGSTTRIVVRSTTSLRRDQALERCIEGVVKSLPFIGIGQPLAVTHEISIGERRSFRPTTCSEASRVSLPVRREVWRAQVPMTEGDYRAAGERCELRRWHEKEAFLRLMLENVPSGEERLQLSERLFSEGEVDAADFIRDETLRAVSSFEELRNLVAILRQNEPDISDELEKALTKASSHEVGLEICRRFLRLAPHNTYARKRLMAYLEALGNRGSLVTTIREWRSEAISDAGLLADAASALVRNGEGAEGRRTFGELIERAPRDPWTLAFVGDRLRAEGFYERASAVYASLARMLPEDAGVTLRLALAHAGAGRLDVASRLLRRVSETGGRNDDGLLSDLAGVVEANLLARARGGKDKEAEAELERRLARTHLPDAEAIVLLHAPPATSPVHLSLRRDGGEILQQGADMDARDLGLSAARIERGQKGAVVLALRRDQIAGPSHPLEATLSILRLGPPGSVPEVQEKVVRVPADGNPLEIKVEGGLFL